MLFLFGGGLFGLHPKWFLITTNPSTIYRQNRSIRSTSQSFQVLFIFRQPISSLAFPQIFSLSSSILALPVGSQFSIFHDASPAHCNLSLWWFLWWILFFPNFTQALASESLSYINIILIDFRVTLATRRKKHDLNYHDLSKFTDFHSKSSWYWSWLPVYYKINNSISFKFLTYNSRYTSSTVWSIWNELY